VEIKRKCVGTDRIGLGWLAAKDLDWDWGEGRWFLGDGLLRHAGEEGGGFVLYMDRAGK
jgi:hypothetical protein